MRKVYLSKFASAGLIAFLEESGWQADQSKVSENVDLAISNHPDLSMCDLGNQVFFGDPHKPKSPYPADVIYNAACTGKYFIHNLKYTDAALKKRAQELNMIMVHVNQGYTKCNTLIVDTDSVIVSDKGMEKPLKASGLDVLLIENKHVVLPGYDYGFIGGASGAMPSALNHNKKTIVFNGNIENHPDCNRIFQFIDRKGHEIKYFKEYPLTDIGSMIFQTK